ncbi:glycosyltransferase [Rhodococcus pyridinivorans]|uniref:glycosyltransferase n=1 Tax=Rhodococcus pyridinivorans TaxID=103816 RepID=UPI002164A250|nr:glycosyltransferase [Rhodococcus pyridinivorans]UVT24063.1 glycosyltransferase [Rhodococcus pyridinivorans]
MAVPGILVHEWIARDGGSEKVLDEFVRTFPDADVLCLWDDADRYPGRTVHESGLARTPLRRSKALALSAMPYVWRRRPGSYDFALVSSHCFAHHVTFRGAPSGFEKFVYVHTPARYLWNPELDDRGASLAVRCAAPPLRALDRRRAREGAHFAANSDFVRRRIERAWDVEARVIFPPVETARISSVPDWRDELSAAESALLEGLPETFVLGASRFVPYKRLDWVIRAADLAGVPAVIAGSGPEEGRLRQLADEATVPVHVLARPSDALLYALYQQAHVYVFPAVEDFGIMPVEARAAGARVVVNALGGAGETVAEGVDGLCFRQDRVEAVAECIAAIDGVPKGRNEAVAALSSENFQQHIRDWVGEGIGTA